MFAEQSETSRSVSNLVDTAARSGISAGKLAKSWKYNQLLRE